MSSEKTKEEAIKLWNFTWIDQDNLPIVKR